MSPSFFALNAKSHRFLSKFSRLYNVTTTSSNQSTRLPHGSNNITNTPALINSSNTKFFRSQFPIKINLINSRRFPFLRFNSTISVRGCTNLTYTSRFTRNPPNNSRLTNTLRLMIFSRVTKFLKLRHLEPHLRGMRFPNRTILNPLGIRQNFFTPTDTMIVFGSTNPLNRGRNFVVTSTRLTTVQINRKCILNFLTTTSIMSRFSLFTTRTLIRSKTLTVLRNKLRRGMFVKISNPLCRIFTRTMNNNSRDDVLGPNFNISKRRRPKNNRIKARRLLRASQRNGKGFIGPIGPFNMLITVKSDPINRRQHGTLITNFRRALRTISIRMNFLLSNGTNVKRIFHHYQKARHRVRVTKGLTTLVNVLTLGTVARVLILTMTVARPRMNTAGHHFRFKKRKNIRRRQTDLFAPHPRVRRVVRVRINGRFSRLQFRTHLFGGMTVNRNNNNGTYKRIRTLETGLLGRFPRKNIFPTRREGVVSTSFFGPRGGNAILELLIKRITF